MLFKNILQGLQSDRVLIAKLGWRSLDEIHHAIRLSKADGVVAVSALDIVQETADRTNAHLQWAGLCHCGLEKRLETERKGRWAEGPL